MNNSELEKIIKGCIEGNRAAQQELFKAFSEDLFGVCLYYSRDYAEAEDVLHDGFLKIFKKIEQVKNMNSLLAWMKKVMINTALEKYRRNHHLYLVGDSSEFNNDIDPNDLFSDIAARDLLKMVQELSPQYRLVFNLFAIEGYTHKDISEMMGISEGTSKSNLSRARTILQEKVRNFFADNKYNANEQG